MKEITYSNPILLKSKQFLSSRKNSNELVNILSHFEIVPDVDTAHVLAIRHIFEELHKRKELNLEDKKGGEVECKYRKWLLDCYNESSTKLLHTVSQSENVGVQKEALLTVLLFSELDKNLPEEKDSSFRRFHESVEAVIKCHSNFTDLVPILKEHITTVEDGIDVLWTCLDIICLKESKPSGQLVKNLIALVDVLPKKKAAKTKDSEKVIQNCATRVWEWCLNHHPPSALKSVLIVLLEHFMVLHNNPIYLTDFLIDTLNKGGATSLLALQGIYTLILKHNIDYPNIYGKLYTMLQPEIFQMKYKPRFFYLLDLFLTSTHLPGKMVASFAKRLARLALRCAPHDILIVIPFIGNLLIRHPSLKRLINHPTGDTVDSDPFNMEEEDPMKSNALESSLWEIKSLQEHVLPSVSRAAMFINNPLPSVEWDLSDKLETTCDQIFNKEKAKKQKTLSTTFERPSSLSVPRGPSFDEIWLLQ